MNKKALSALSQLDWDFANVGNEGLTAFHWYPATFVSALPGSIIPVLSRPGAVVADPFCGSGTTGVEAVRLGRRFVGSDINPVAALITRARLAFPTVRDLDELRQITSRLPLQSPSELKVDESEIRRWYHADTIKELAFILDEIYQVRSKVAREVGLAVFSSILKTTCSQSRHWGWVCDNVRPKKKEMVYKSGRRAFLRALDEYSTGYFLLREDMRNRSTWASASRLRSQLTVMHGDAVSCLACYGERSVDLIFTSPPYFGVADYVKSQRLTLLWLQSLLLASEEGGSLEELRLRETGARSKRHRRASAAEYLAYMSSFFQAATQSLRRKGFLCMVVGESSARERTLALLDESAQSCGLDKVFETSRLIREDRRRMMASVMEERIIVYRLK